ncbi:MAG TPA: TlpA disulfide reductase family protein [Gemmataceae bacterium]|nr:TlpA disulfide reductase family protein [Gemmataceae bacterium]
MRIVACVGLLIAGLGVGCTSSGKKPAQNSAPGASSGSGSAATGTSGALGSETPTPPPPFSGALLAGQVKDTFDRAVTKASILVEAVPSAGGTPPAPVRVQADERGNFFIPGLDRGQKYQLTAQIKEGTRVVAEGKLWTPAPNPCLLIRVSEDNVSSETTPIPDRTPYPGDTTPKPDKKKGDKPGATIGGPLSPRNDTSATPADVPVTVPHRELIGDNGPLPPGVRPPVKAVVPPPAPAREESLLPVPQSAPDTRTPKPAPAVPSLSERSAPIPWCTLVGKKLDFALYDLNGQPWELSRNRKGRLLLIDFWHTQCPPCLVAIRQLNALQKEYASGGLQVVGIAYETGTPEERVRQVQEIQKVTGRIQYTILMGGHRTAPSSCPVHSRLEVAAHPTLFLVDENGTVVRRFDGLNVFQLRDLTKEIEDRLGLRLR